MSHLGVAEWGRVFRLLTEVYSGKILGLTATPVRYLDHERNIADEYSCKNILKKHLADGQRHKVVVFADSIYIIHDAIGLCSGIFPDAKHLTVHSKLGKKMNLSVYQLFEEKEGNVFLYVVDILNEGIHLKGIDTEITFRKTKSPADHPIRLCA